MLDLIKSVFKRTNMSNEEHAAVIGAIENQLNILKEDVGLQKTELVPLTSTGQWMDVWGSWVGQPRLAGESDDHYRSRVIAILSSPNNTIPSIVFAVKKFIGSPTANVQVLEPWRKVATYSGTGEFSGDYVYESGDYYRSGVIDIYIPSLAASPTLYKDPVNAFASLRDTISKIKPAGVKVYYTFYNELGFPTDPVVAIVADTQPYTDVERTVEPRIEVNTNTSNFSDYQQLSSSPGVLSGNQLLFYENVRETDMYVPGVGETPFDAENEQISMIYAGRSTTAFRSGNESPTTTFNGGFSGYPLNSYDLAHPLPWDDRTIEFGPTDYIGFAEDSGDFGVEKTTEMQVTEGSPVGVTGAEADKTIESRAIIGLYLNASSLCTVNDVANLTINWLSENAIPYIGPVQSEQLPA